MEVHTAIDVTCDGYAKAIIVGPGGWGSVTDALPIDVAINAARSWAHTLGCEYKGDSK